MYNIAKQLGKQADAEAYRKSSEAYYYKGTGNKENEDTISSIILGNSLLTARGIPVAGDINLVLEHVNL